MNLYERNQKVRNFFNEKIDTYDDVHSEFMQTKEALVDALDNDSKKILDLGAGTGLELIHLFELYPDAKVTVIDITENMLDELKKRSFADHVTTICGDFFEIEFGDGYDAVISTSALHHFKKEEKRVLYKKIYECLKNDGQFINCDLIAPDQGTEDWCLNELENNLDNHTHLDTPITIEHEIEILEDTGFSEITSNNVDKENYSLIKARKL